MTALIITLSVFIVLIFSIVSANLDAEIIKNRNKVHDPRTLKHNTRATLRGIYIFFVTMLGYAPLNLAFDTSLITILCIFLINGIVFYISFTTSMNNVRNLNWHYLGGNAWSDKMIRNIFGQKGFITVASILTFIFVGLVILMIELY